MTGWFDPSMDGVSEWLAGLVMTASVKAAAVFAGAALAAVALRRRSAAARHLAWSIAVVAALGLPAVGAVLPGWWVGSPMPMSRPDPLEPGRSPTAARASSLAPRSIEIADLARTARWQPDDGVPESWTEHSPGAPVRSVSRAWEVPLIIQNLISVMNRSWTLGLWAAGALLAGIPVLLGMLSLGRVARASAPVTDPAILGLARRLAARLGVSRPIRLVLHPDRDIPMTWGLLRPVILLPADAIAWPEERLTTALLHELAHVSRWDCLTQLAARAACALYWFNPLAWLALSRIRREQEQAADDRALGCGIAPHAYAGHLLAIVSGRTSGGRHAAVAPAMAASSNLERRLRGILDASRSRRQPGRRTIGLVAAAAALLILPLAALNPRAGAAPLFPASPDPQAAAQVPPPRGPDPPRPVAVGVETEVLAKVREVSIKPPDESALRQGAIRGILETLHDPYSTYFDAQQMASMDQGLQGKVTGIGVQLQAKDGRVTVLAPLPDSPAIKAGIRPGDIIDEVDGKPTRGIGLSQVARWILGNEGEVVRLKVKHADGRAEDLAVTRGVVKIRTVQGFRLSDGRSEFLLDPEHGIGYAHLSQFGADTPNELKAVIEDLKGRGVKGLIFDLRGCPGGLMSGAVEVAQLFLSQGTIVTIRGRDAATRSLTAQGPAPAADLPLVLLCDGTTASAAEILAGALKDNDRAIIVGSRTVGKGSIQSIVKLKDDPGALRLTTAYYQLPRGADIDRKEGKADWGIDPTDGYYSPVEGQALDALSQRRQQREHAGGPGPAGAAGQGKVTPESIERDEADPPLAAALKALIARTTRGAFEKTGLPLAEQAAHLKRIDEVRKRRQSLLEDLKKVEQELGQLGQRSESTR